jgi:hypothetical protein
LKNNPPSWNDAMNKVVRRIKDKVQTLPPLSRPTGEGNCIIERDASNSTWEGVLIENINEVDVGSPTCFCYFERQTTLPVVAFTSSCKYHYLGVIIRL